MPFWKPVFIYVIITNCRIPRVHCVHWTGGHRLGKLTIDERIINRYNILAWVYWEKYHIYRCTRAIAFRPLCLFYAKNCQSRYRFSFLWKTNVHGFQFMGYFISWQVELSCIVNSIRYEKFINSAVTVKFERWKFNKSD